MKKKENKETEGGKPEQRRAFFFILSFLLGSFSSVGNREKQKFI